MASGGEELARAYAGNVQALHEEALERLLVAGVTAATPKAGGTVISYIWDQVWKKEKDEPDTPTTGSSSASTELSAQRPRRMDNDFDNAVSKFTPFGPARRQTQRVEIGQQLLFVHNDDHNNHNDDQHDHKAASWNAIVSERATKGKRVKTSDPWWQGQDDNSEAERRQLLAEFDKRNKLVEKLQEEVRQLKTQKTTNIITTNDMATGPTPIIEILVHHHQILIRYALQII